MATTASIIAGPSRSNDSPVFHNPLYGKATGLVLLSGASSVAGFLVELLLTRRYGNTGTMDAYRITGSILTIGTQLLFVQVLPLVLIPLFTSARLRSGEREASRLALRFGGSLTLAAVGVFVVSLLAPGSFAQLLGPGLRGEGYNAAVTLVPVMTGTLVMLVSCGAIAAVLNCYGVFWTLPAATLLMNVGIIVCVVCWPGALPIAAVCVGMMAGCTLALAVHFVCLRRITGSAHPRPREHNHAEWVSRSSGWASFFPVLVSAACLQSINILLFRQLSTFSPGSSVVYSFAFRLTGVVHLPAAAFVTVAFPAVAQAGAEGDPWRLEQAAARAIRAILFIAIPCAVATCVLRRPLVELLTGHSAMSASGVERAGSLLGLLLLGAPTGALIGILQRVLASCAAMWSVALGSAVALAIALWGVAWTSDAEGISILWDVAFWANTAALLGALAILDRRFIHLVSLSYLAKLGSAAVAAGMSAWGVSTVLGHLGWTPGAIVAMSGALAGTVALASAHLARMPEATEMIQHAAIQWRRAWSLGR